MTEWSTCSWTGDWSCSEWGEVPKEGGERIDKNLGARRIFSEFECKSLSIRRRYWIDSSGRKLRLKVVSGGDGGGRREKQKTLPNLYRFHEIADLDKSRNVALIKLSSTFGAYSTSLLTLTVRLISLASLVPACKVMLRPKFRPATSFSHFKPPSASV